MKNQNVGLNLRISFEDPSNIKESHWMLIEHNHGSAKRFSLEDKTFMPYHVKKSYTKNVFII